MNIIDTRDLVQEREDLKEEILNSFLETFEHYEDRTDSYEDILFDEEEIQDWVNDWEDEIQAIKEIDELEDDVSCYARDNGDNFNDGVSLIDEQDYTEVEFRGVTYLYR